MNCPHCRIAFHDNEPRTINIGVDIDGGWQIVSVRCPSCRRFCLWLRNAHPNIPLEHWRQPHYGTWELNGMHTIKDRLVHPKGSNRPPIPPEVPLDIAEDYLEACLVLGDSPKASAALSRRCLQNLLRNYAKVKPGDLAPEIQQVLDSKQLPSHLADSIDAIRHIGNFAAHPNKSKHTGDIMPVEPGEAEWSLDVLEGLFDFYFVQPQVMAKKRAALDAKLSEVGKPPMK